MTANIPQVVCQQGGQAKVIVRLKNITPFEGQAIAQLKGLPSRVTAEAVQFDQNAQQIILDLKADTTSPVGNHNGLTCFVTVLRNGESLVAEAGKFDLQIDPAAAGEQLIANSDGPSASGSNDLEAVSRLERLRREAKQRAEARLQQKGE